MEKLQKALERARLEREARAVVEPSPSADDDAKPINGTKAPALAEPSAGAMPISYSDTRVVDIDPASLRERRLIIGPDGDALADIFRILRTQVLQRLVASNYTTLAVISPNPGEGKSLIAANLALGITRYKNHTVLLVDLDLRRPNVHRMFGLRPEVGLTDFFLNDVPLARCLINPRIERLVVLPAGSPLASSSETLSSPKMVHLADELKSRYPDRIVIYDLPPLLTTDDALVFLRHVDCCLLVVEEGSTRVGDIERALELLEGRDLIGTVLNKSSEKSQSYYY